ncbi:MAG: hypothetical protein COA79_12830 [Planctomycetota bacterium]|nr:MAG: hypothetical protein COA79_12830 [Planctomycetota bacterium]
MNKSNLTQVLRRFSTDHYEDTSINKYEVVDNSVLFCDRKNNLEFGIANNAADRIQAYRLVYNLYVEKEFAKPDKIKMWKSLFDAHKDTVTFIAKQKSKVVGAITIVIDSKMGLPADNLFQEDIQSLRNSKKNPAEIISLAIDNSIKGAQNILIKLFNYVYISGRSLYGASNLIITINPRHVFYYKKKLLFNQMGAIKTYDKVGGADAVLLTLDYSKTDLILNKTRKEEFKTNTVYPFFINHEEEISALEKIKSEIKPMSSAEFIYLFKDLLGNKNNSQDEHLEYLKDIFYNAVSI